ncbi:MAG: D-alanyl-D-alanine carboxypeptidase family protein [Verrucomicrobiia bacterium]|tara:strand:- start:3940 stop:4878 length:939 start_codon:yes stop_codon:yes gene_type:complete
MADVYKGAIVVDAADGSVLFADKSDFKGPPASVTKLMTFLVVQDAIKAGEISLDTRVTVSAEDSRMGGTQVWLAHNEVFTVQELLYALMIQSANDAAHALSHTAATDRTAFVARMNERALQLGMLDTIWRTPHGLPPRLRKLSETDQTSPRDLATLSIALLRETDVLHYSSIKSRPFGEGYRAKPVMMRTHNHLIGKVAGVDGLKTGFTRAAGFCLSATAERDGRRIVAVLMGCPTSQERDIRMVELIEQTFATLNPSPISRAPVKPTISPAPMARLPNLPELQFTPIDLTLDPEAPLATDTEPPTVVFELP